MNETSYHPKLHVSITLGTKVFVAGEDAYGKVELACNSESVGLRAIRVVLIGFQQLMSKYHAATSTFLETPRIFQGTGLPPSNAVLPHSTNADLDLPPDYYPARKGQTTFFFRFPLPPSSPSAITFGNGLARVTYRVKAGVEVFWNGERHLVVDSREIDVVETLDEEAPMTDLGHAVVGDGGRIWAHARITGGLCISGRPTCCVLHVKNNSTRKISGVTLNLLRKLHIQHPAADNTGIETSDSVLSIPFRGPAYTVQAFSEGVANLVFTIPRNTRGVRSGLRENAEGNPNVVKESLFDIQCNLNLRLGMGFTAPDLEILVPMRIYHPSAIPPSLQPPDSPVSVEARDRPYSPLVTPALFMQERAFAAPPSPQFVPHLLSPRPHDEQVHLPMSAYSPTQAMLYSLDPASHAPSTTSYQYPWISSPHTPPPFVQSQPYNAYDQGSVIPQIFPESRAQYLIRSSSADPYTSQPPIHHIAHLFPSQFVSPGMLHVPPLADQVRRGFDDSGEPEDRATRISQHLRLSSRHRSVSPPRSRYVIGSRSPTTFNVDASVGHSDASGNHTSNNIVTVEQPSPVSISPLHSPILSPRPVHSPNHTFSNDDLDGSSNPGGRSPRVEELERLVSESTGKNSEHDGNEHSDPLSAPPDVQPSESLYPPLINGIDKTLPHRPMTREKIATRVRGLPAAMDIFSGVDAVPKAIIPLSKSNASLNPPSLPSPEGVGGLTLLERRLLSRAVAMPEVTQQRGAHHHHHRQVDEEKAHPRAQASPASQNVGDHNTPSRSLASTIRLSAAETNVESRRSAIREMRSEANARVTEWLAREKNAKQSLERDFNSRRRNVGRANRDQGDLDSVSKADEPSTTRSVSGSSLPPYEAQVRVPRTDEALGTPKPPGAKASPTVAISKEPISASTEPGVLSRNHLVPRPDLDVLAQETKPPLFKLPAYPPLPPTAPGGARYDVRSARGGRGGIVTSVASSWGNISNGPKEAIPPAEESVRSSVHRVDAPQIINTGFKKSVLPLDTIRKAADAPQGPSSSRSGVKDHPRKLPAMILKQPPLAGLVNGTVGRPILSSAATLARPMPQRIGRVASPLLSQPQEQVPAAKSRSENPPAVGRARLRELIERYQN